MNSFSSRPVPLFFLRRREGFLHLVHAGAMSRTTISVSHASSEIFKKLKARFNAKSADELILALADVQPGEEDELSSLSSESLEQEAPQKRRKKNVREPLFSFELLADRPEMLEYYTGFDASAIKCLSERLGEVRVVDCIFCSSSSSL